MAGAAAASADRSLIKLYYDVISPYSWFAFEALQRYSTVWNVDVLLKPFFLGGVMNASGNTPPMLVNAKAKYMERDLANCAKYWGVPLNPLKDPQDAILAKGTLKAQRYLCSVQLRATHLCVPATRALWLRRWSRDMNIHSNKDLEQVSSDIGMAPELIEQVLDGIESREVKTMLKSHSSEAVNVGAFGSPWIVVKKARATRDHMFFGSDRFHVIADLLDEPFPGPMRHLSVFQDEAVPPAATAHM